jgi:hypothetical protein
MYIEANPQVRQQVDILKGKNHPHLEQAQIAVAFTETKPFIKDRLNLGKVSKFSKSAKLWHPKDKKYDFCIYICSEVWFGMLNDHQKEAYLDLKLCQCKIEYLPEYVEENGKKIPVKDEFGRISYTNEVKYDKDGLPIWKVVPADLKVYAENIKRYGLWFEELLELKEVIEKI